MTTPEDMTEEEVREVMREAAIAAAIGDLEEAAKADKLPQWAADALAAILAREKKEART